MVFYDDKKDSVLGTVELNQEIKCSILSYNKLKIIVGTSEGAIFIFEIRSQYQLAKFHPFGTSNSI